MTQVDRRQMASRLRAEAERIRRHGLYNFSEHTFACLMYGQVSKSPEEERCGDCPNRPFVPPEFAGEAFPCQHITEEGWDQAAAEPGQAERTVEWLLRTADRLEAKEETPKAGR